MASRRKSQKRKKIKTVDEFLEQCARELPYYADESDDDADHGGGESSSTSPKVVVGESSAITGSDQGGGESSSTSPKVVIGESSATTGSDQGGGESTSTSPKVVVGESSTTTANATNFAETILRKTLKPTSVNVRVKVATFKERIRFHEWKALHHGQVIVNFFSLDYFFYLFIYLFIYYLFFFFL
jgi:hypothetical protein